MTTLWFTRFVTMVYKDNVRNIVWGINGKKSSYCDRYKTNMLGTNQPNNKDDIEQIYQNNDKRIDEKDSGLLLLGLENKMLKLYDRYQRKIQEI